MYLSKFFFYKNKFILNKNFYVNLNIKMNHIYLYFLNFFNLFYLPSFFFFKDLKLKFFSKFYFKSFIAHFKTGYSKLFFFFFFKFKLRGLGYRAKFVSNIFLEYL